MGVLKYVYIEQQKGSAYKNLIEIYNSIYICVCTFTVMCMLKPVIVFVWIYFRTVG